MPKKWSYSEVEQMALATDPAWWQGLTPAQRRAAAREVNAKAAEEAKIRDFLLLKPSPARKAPKR